MYFEDYASHAGVQLPRTMVFEFFEDGGTVVFQFDYDETKINLDVDDSLFEKP